ncbi:MAG: ABC transporter permease subunit [Hyphomicrobiales bacterium]|nr:ABC transporter permease subunit [Hyphomicrobiales bacterium]
MGDLSEAFRIAFHLLASFDRELFEIIALSLKVSLVAVAISCFFGFLMGAALCVYRFRGKQIIVIIINALMGLPPVVVGLCVYLMLSRSGPLGVFGLLYTPTAMIIAQVLLITPLIGALSLQVLHEMHKEYDEFFRSLHLSPLAKIKTLLWDARFGLIIVGLAGFGRAISEVGAVMIVGGNINHLTRIMTTAIALETSKGTLALALALGIILLGFSVSLNAAVMFLRSAISDDKNA